MATSQGQLYSEYSQINQVYSDFTMNMDVHPDTGDLFIITNDNAIKSSIRNIINTNFGERFYNYNFGGNITSSLFNPSDQNEYYMLQSAIKNSLSSFETRISVISVSVTPSNPASGVMITIQYTILNIAQVQILNIFVKRIR